MAAGLGFKTFTTGEVLTAADTNGYLMQGVNVFANAAARTAAITSPQEGQMSYLKDTDSVESYSGSAWVAVGGSVATSLGFTAGKNRIINGDFGVNQRNFTSNTASDSYNFDRFVQLNGGTTGTLTVTPQTFALGTAPVAGYEGKNFVQCVTAAGASTDTYAIYAQKIESVRTLAGQTATISFWAKAASGTPKIGVEVEQFFGTGGSPSAEVRVSGGAVTLSTSWTRYSVTVSVPSLSGKIIGTNNNDQLAVFFWMSAGTSFASRASSIGLQNATFQIWGVQVEAGTSATAFQTATGTIESELANCQRYYFRTQTGTDAGYFGVTAAGSSTTTYANVIMKQTMRTTPTSLDFSGLKWQAINNSGNITAASISGATPENVLIVCTTTGATAGAMNFLAGQSNTAYVGFSAEL